MDITIVKLILKQPQQEATSDLKVLVGGQPIFQMELEPKEKTFEIGTKINKVKENDKIIVQIDDNLVGECKIEDKASQSK